MKNFRKSLGDQINKQRVKTSNLRLEQTEEQKTAPQREEVKRIKVRQGKTKQTKVEQIPSAQQSAQQVQGIQSVSSDSDAPAFLNSSAEGTPER